LAQRHSWFLVRSTFEEPHFGQHKFTFGVFLFPPTSLTSFSIKYYPKPTVKGAMFFSANSYYCFLRLKILSKKSKKAEGLEQHKKLQREKDQKRKERKQVSLPAKHQGKGKK